VGAIAERNPMLRQIDFTGIVEKLGGFPVYTVNHVMGGTLESTLKKIEQKSLDPGAVYRPQRLCYEKEQVSRSNQAGKPLPRIFWDEAPGPEGLDIQYPSS